MSSSSRKSNKPAGSRGTALVRSLLASDALSGELMARKLGVTRAALWKQISALRERGFSIEGARGEGYRLIGMPELSAEGIMASVSGPIGREVICLDKTESTNDVAMGLASEGAAHGTAVVADSQAHGRGRRGRPWISAPGAGLLMSVILRPAIFPEDAPILTYICSLAAAEALRKATGIEVTLKWPNDLMVNDKKLGGLLIEMRTEPGAVLYAVAGFGINASTRRAAMPASIRQSATSLWLESRRKFTRTALASAILDALSNELDSYTCFGPDAIMARWRLLCGTLGRKVTVLGPQGAISGIASDIDRLGRLVLVTPDGAKHALSSGDVTIGGAA